jgi:NitT/TauT family transport system substrate-binding protein
VYYAQDLGLFTKAGLDVRIQAFASGAQVAAAAAAGSLDLGVTNTTSAAAGHLRGLDFKFIAPAAVASGRERTDLIMVANDSPIQKASDLNGKTVGVNGLKGSSQITVMAWCDKNGGDSRSLKFVELGFSQMATAVADHRVDAVALVEPYVTSAKGLARPLGNTLDCFSSPFMVVGYFGTASWLGSNVGVATRFAAAIREAAAWANTHQKESGAMLVRYAKLDPTVAATMARSTYGQTVTTALLQPMIDASAKYGAIDRTFPASELIWQPARP